MPAGRPTLYKPEYCQMLIDHMAQGLSFESFGGVVDVSKQTLYDWEKVNPEFLDAKKRGESHSRLVWEKHGIEGLYSTETCEYENGRLSSKTSKSMNTGIWCLNMKNRFKWTDRVEVEDKSPKTIKLQYSLDDDKSDDKGNGPADESDKE